MRGLVKFSETIRLARYGGNGNAQRLAGMDGDALPVKARAIS